MKTLWVTLRLCDFVAKEAARSDGIGGADGYGPSHMLFPRTAREEHPTLGALAVVHETMERISRRPSSVKGMILA